MSKGAQTLSKLDFSDIILNEHGLFFLKGVPGMGSKLMLAKKLGPDVMQELQIIVQELMAKKVAEDCPAQRYSHANSRYRVSCEFDIMSGRTWFIRRMASHTPLLRDLTVKPAYVIDWLRSPQMGRGLCLFAGSQACGKTTLASATVAERLYTYGGHCVTFEAPAEMPLSGAYGDFGYCWQTEIPTEQDLPSYIVRAHVFASPDIIYIGEIKSSTAAVEALRIALGSPRQVVVATIHGIDLVSALKRLLDWTMAAEGANAATNLAMSLSTIVMLELKAGPDGKRFQEVPECLFVPFDDKATMSNSIRAQIRDGHLENLRNSIGQMRVKLDRTGLQGLY